MLRLFCFLLFGCRHTDFPFEVILLLSDRTLDSQRSNNKVRLANGSAGLRRAENVIRLQELQRWIGRSADDGKPTPRRKILF